MSARLAWRLLFDDWLCVGFDKVGNLRRETNGINQNQPDIKIIRPARPVTSNALHWLFAFHFRSNTAPEMTALPSTGVNVTAISPEARNVTG